MLPRTTILAALLSLVASSAAAETRAAIVAAGDVHLAPAASGHGIVVAQADLGDLRLRFNTDTLDVSWGGVDLGDHTTLRVGVAGEALVAGLMPQYFQRGVIVRSRGFSASWAGGYVALERRLGREVFLGSRSTARRWWFGELASTRDTVLPADFTGLEEEVSLTWWAFDPDPSLWEAHRLFRRLRGVGGGMAVDFQWRSQARAWGNPADPRNGAEPRNVALTQWAAVGFGPRAVRLQVEEHLRLGASEDDLNRARVGGFNPYAVHLAGVVWPAFLTSKLLAGTASLHVDVFGDTEVGTAFDSVMLQDPLRDGSLGYGVFGGVSAFVDARHGPWQGDARFGWTLPTSLLANGPQLGAFLALGRAF